MLEGTDPSLINSNGVRPIFVRSSNSLVSAEEYKTDVYRLQFYMSILGWKYSDNVENDYWMLIPRLTVALKKAIIGSYDRYLLESVIKELGLTIDLK